MFGTVSAYVGGQGRAFRYCRELGVVLLDAPQGQAAEAAAGNDNGVIVGAIGGWGHSVRPVKWVADGTFVELNGLPSAVSAALAINDREDIVGTGMVAGPRALLWSDDYGAIDLNDLLTPQQRFHWELRIAYDVNDERQIVGMATFDPDGLIGPAPAVNELFMLTLAHMPEPGVGAYLLVACALLRRRRASTTSP